MEDLIAFLNWVATAEGWPLSDLTVWGLQPDGKPWAIDIVNPNAAGQVFSYLEVVNMAIATSGSRPQRFIHEVIL